eukprot:scaffold25498_cov84-Isochrysis_galbana.AAC.1
MVPSVVRSGLPRLRCLRSCHRHFPAAQTPAAASDKKAGRSEKKTGRSAPASPSDPLPLPPGRSMTTRKESGGGPRPPFPPKWCQRAPSGVAMAKMEAPAEIPIPIPSVA